MAQWPHHGSQLRQILLNNDESAPSSEESPTAEHGTRSATTRDLRLCTRCSSTLSTSARRFVDSLPCQEGNTSSMWVITMQRIQCLLVLQAFSWMRPVGLRSGYSFRFGLAYIYVCFEPGLVPQQSPHRTQLSTAQPWHFLLRF